MHLYDFGYPYQSYPLKSSSTTQQSQTFAFLGVKMRRFPESLQKNIFQPCKYSSWIQPYHVVKVDQLHFQLYHVVDLDFQALGHHTCAMFDRAILSRTLKVSRNTCFRLVITQQGFNPTMWQSQIKCTSSSTTWQSWNSKHRCIILVQSLKEPDYLGFSRFLSLAALVKNVQ